MKSYLLLSLCCLLEIITCKYTQSLLRKLTEELVQDKVNQSYQHKIIITLGGQDLKVKLTTSFCGLWVFNKDIFDKGFNPSLSTTLTRSGMRDEMEFVSGTVVYDTFDLDDTTVINLPFLLVDKVNIVRDYTYDGIIAFGYHCDNHLSRIDLMDLQARANHSLTEVTSFLLYKDTNKGFIDAGLYPPKLSKFPKYYRTTKITNPDPKIQWSVSLDSVYFDDGTHYRVNDYLSIGMNGNVISVKRSFFMWFSNAFFAKLLNEKKCEINTEGIFEILCDQDTEMPHIGTISFIVGKWNFKVDGKNLVKVVDRGVKRKWVALVHYGDHDQFYIPQNYLKGIYIVYDKKKSEVGFMFRPQRNDDHKIID